MPSDIRITMAPSPIVGSETAAGVRPTGAVPASAAQATAAPSATANPTPNPTLELDAALGLVVIQFHNDSGAVTSSIPSQQQIDAYRLWQETRIGPAPNLGEDMAPLPGATPPA
jgi:hypothetical protein